MVESGGSVTTSHCVMTNAATMGQASNANLLAGRAGAPSKAPANIHEKYPMPNQSGPTMTESRRYEVAPRADLEMIMAERKARQRPQILHGKGHRDANRENGERIFPAINSEA